MSEFIDRNRKILLGRRNLLSGLATGLVVGGVGLSPAKLLAQSTNCIGGNSGLVGAGGHSWRIFENATPPYNNSSSTANSYLYWPCTDAYSSNQGVTVNGYINNSTWTGGNCWAYIWGNRCNNLSYNKPNNLQMPIEYLGNDCRAQYTTVAKANAATQSQIRAWLGMSNFADPWIAAGGSASDFKYWSQLYASPQTYFTQQITVTSNNTTTTFQVMTDIPWLLSTQTGGAGSFTRATMMSGNQALVPGIVLDYEVGDRRTAQQSTDFFTNIYGDLASAHAKLFIWTDPLNRTASEHGLDNTNLPNICQNYCDYLSIQLTGLNGDNFAQSYESQISVLKGSNCAAAILYSKLSIVFDLNYSTLNDAQFVNNLLNGTISSNPQIISFWRDGEVQGDTCTSNPNKHNIPANYIILATLEGSGAVPNGPVPPTALPQGWQPSCPFP